jgi:uncharacterized DUF497 family protein
VLLRSDDYEWDEEKAAINLLKHGVRFEKAIDIFEDPLVATFTDRSHSTDEHRVISIGATFWNEVLVVSHTTRGERIRIISARHATKAERRKFMNKKHDYINDKDDLQPEYDFDYSKAEVGKYYNGRGRLVVHVSLDDDVVKHFSTAESVNAALRQLIAEGRAPEPRTE